jgi:hypothetical protein
LSAANPNATQNNITQTIAADMDAVVIRQRLHSEVSLLIRLNTSSARANASVRYWCCW